ncbi:hypothetical protein HV824_32315 [Myxococcus sp. AM009]|uniref:hypothetical protein n=1 Tax=unclassified Myxococcus TaxID=2648731 RepID=UPI0015958C64|nr:MULTISPECIES: hypothetical protein [unclassified Myxococcus]NVJ02780.1 hypothetical protein [Myxococcus sp. AM009]NVJ19318.1 hypothetical protein [Myxococcus sp. AM010]
MKISRRAAPLAALLALGGLGACASRQQAPTAAAKAEAPRAAEPVVQSTEGGFSVAIPGPVSEERRSQETDVGAVTLHTFIAVRPEVDTAYYVSYTDFPAAAVSQADPRDVVARASHGALEALGATGLSARPLVLSGFPGWEVEGVSGPRHLRGRFFLVGPRLYQQLLLHPEGKPPQDADRFFESFQLDPQVAAMLTGARRS